ncbi:uncharacterized protein An12g08130 [Aspergillus niger]|uniref:Contig An12c0270, genomic contig n=2 Tax=Aspergillus niger TaxID=5061 RepID=A2R0C5_ASPNC|nr:uncharacterized protein An12g08130 [Aspergillus niger]CAK41263.1 unnamed protein product [Aspergillus niger]
MYYGSGRETGGNRYSVRELDTSTFAPLHQPTYNLTHHSQSWIKSCTITVTHSRQFGT